MDLKKINSITLIIALMSMNFLWADEGDKENKTFMNVGFKAGTLGVGIDISTPINSWISLRFNANKFNYATTDTSNYSSVLQADREYKLKTMGLLLDYQLLQLRLTTGLYINDNQIVETTKPKGNSNIFINKKAYTLSGIAEVESTVVFNKVSPYVGIGWGNNGSIEGLTVTLDIGLMYHGNPKLELKAKTNPNLPDRLVKIIKNDIKEEQKKQEDDLSNFPFYPVVMIGLNYSF